MKPQLLPEEEEMEQITRPELNAKFAEVDAKIDGKFAELNIKIDTKIDAMVHMLRTEMERMANIIIRWVIGLVFGGLVLQVTIMTFVLNNAVPDKPAAPAPAPAPIVIYLPQPQQAPAVK